MNDGQLNIDTDGVCEIAAGFSLDSERFGAAAAPLREGLTAEGGAAWVSAQLAGAGEILTAHSTVKQSADRLLEIVTRDIAGMGVSAQEVTDSLVGQDVANGTDIDSRAPRGDEPSRW